ncbi:MAG: hypothetical protein KF764_33550 [Labilithrix sp.]|nr:hypothetical protein [Labilithrix sp.]
MTCRGRLLSMAACAASLATAAGVLVACSDSDTSTPGDGTSLDAGSDTSPQGTDAGAPDAADGAAPDAGQDGGPTISAALGSTGYVQIRDTYIVGAFREDDTILRASNAPECVAHIRSATKPISPAGTLTIGGAIVGADGGPEQAIVVDPLDPTDPLYLYQPDPPPEVGGVFPPTETLVVQIEGSGSLTFPLMPAQSLPSPAAGAIAFTKPAVDLDNPAPVVLPTSQAFEVTWTPPANPHADHRIILALQEVAAEEAPRLGSLHCSFPIASGKGTIPANLLAELRSRVGGQGTAEGLFHVLAGGYKEFTGGGASYVIEVSRDDTGLTVLPAELQ